MLQNDAVRNLQYDNGIRVAQQPRSSESIDLPRIPLPIPMVTSNCTFITVSGYDFLINLPSVHVEQTFELNESLTAIASENRYVVRSPLGDAIFLATESSTQNHRLIWGSARPFQMHLIDKTNQEAMVFRKKLALGSICCQPKTLEIWIPPGDLLGRIVQVPTFTQPEFYIEDGETGQSSFCIVGPANLGFCCFCPSKECFFKIHSGDHLRASIDHKWLANKSQYTTNIYFSDSKLTAKERALILGAAFLLEYIYFQSHL